MKNKILLCVLIVAIIIIAIMSYSMYTITNQKNENAKQVEELNSQVVELQNTLNSISNVISASQTNTTTEESKNSTSNTTTQESQKETSKLTDSEAEKLVESKYTELKDILFEHNSSNKYFAKSSTLTQSAGGYLITNYDEIMEKYFSANGKSTFENIKNSEFEKICCCLKFVNKKLYSYEGGGFGSGVDGLKSVTDINVTDSKISATLVLNVVDPDGNKLDDKKSTMKLTLNDNNEWVIDDFDINAF